MGHYTHHNNEGLCCTVRYNRPGLPVLRNPVLARQARQVQEEELDSYKSGPYAPAVGGYGPVDRDDSASSASGTPYAAPHGAAPHAGPDHVDYGAYTGGYGAFGWYTDHPVLLGPGGRTPLTASVLVSMCQHSTLFRFPLEGTTIDIQCSFFHCKILTRNFE